MGEARFRRELNKFYGRVPKKGMGLVISSPVTIEGRSISGSGVLDPQELRFSLLFWDRLVWPSNSVVRFAGGVDAEFLEAEGILTRPHIIARHATDGAAFFIESHTRVFLDLARREPGLWSMAQGEKSFLNLNIDRPVEPGSLFSIFQAIPVPNADVPLADLLEFKSRRRDELVALRFEIEGIASRLQKAGDDESEFRRAITEIEMKCIDVLRVASETRLPFRLSSLRTTFAVKFEKLLGPALAAIALKGIEMPDLVAALGGLGVALSSGGLQIGVEGSLVLKEEKLQLHPYRYVSSFSKELYNS